MALRGFKNCDAVVQNSWFEFNVADKQYGHIERDVCVRGKHQLRIANSTFLSAVNDTSVSIVYFNAMDTSEMAPIRIYNITFFTGNTSWCSNDEESSDKLIEEILHVKVRGMTYSSYLVKSYFASGKLFIKTFRPVVLSTTTGRICSEIGLG